MAVASPPFSQISRATVLTVDSSELGSGGNEDLYGFEELFAATATVCGQNGAVRAGAW